MCSKLAKYGLGILLLVMAGMAAGAALAVWGFVSLWWMDGWEALDGLRGQPQELVALRVPEGTFLLRMADGSLYECEQGRLCAPAGAAWSAENGPDTRQCSGATRPWVTSLLPLALNWNTRVALGCEVDYQSTGRNVFVMQDRTGKTFATHGAVFIPTDAGVIGMGLVGGLVGLVAGGAVGVVTALVLLARGKRNQTA